MTKSTEQKIQELELDTVRAVTEMRGDIKNLTEIIKDLKNSINRMTENYVTKEEHLEDITALHEKIRENKTKGRTQTILVGLLTAVLTSVVTYEILRQINN